MSDAAPSTREQILALAQEYLLESGPAGFEVKELARRGWFHQSQINYYFGSKQGLLAEAANAMFAAHIDSVIGAVEAHRDPRAALDAWCQSVIAFNTANGATAALVAYPDLFVPSDSVPENLRIGENVLEATERVGTVLLSIMYALAKGRDYRRLNRAKVTMVAIAMPRVTNSVVMIGMGAAGLAQVWEQHRQKPIFGFDPRKAFLRGVHQIANDLAKSPRGDADPDVSEDDLFSTH